MKKERILVTGATGFIGSHFLRRVLEQERREIFVFLRKDSDPWRIRDLMPFIEPIYADLIDKETIVRNIRSIRPDVVVHFAVASMYEGIASVSEKGLIEVNLLGLVHLLSALEEVDYRAFINIGSSSEYGSKNVPMKEGDICEPLSLYGVTKLAATNYAALWAKVKGRPIVTFRVFSPFGPYDDPRRLVSKICLDFIRGNEPILSGPDLERDFIFIDDLVRLFLLAVDPVRAYQGDVFNAGSGKGHTVEQVVLALADIAGYTGIFHWNSGAERGWESPVWEADISRVVRSFGWAPQVPFLHGLRTTFEWFKEHEHLYQ